jgi:hypothetical protein
MAHISFCFSDGVNISCKIVHAIMENRDALIVTRREIALEVNSRKLMIQLGESSCTIFSLSLVYP